MEWFAYRPDSVTVWSNEEVRKRLSWYYRVMSDEKPAKYLIAKRIPIDIDIKGADERELWEEHERASEDFMEIWGKIKEDALSLTDLERPRKSLLDLKVEIAYRILRECRFCERRCRVNRAEGEKGTCRLDSRTYLSSYFLHMGEEAPLVPSATFFFCSCNFRCVFCQNYDISQEWMKGGSCFEVGPEGLAALFEEMRKRGGRNINLVGGDPTPNVHTILDALNRSRVNFPVLWNSNFYMSEEITYILADVMDIALPDLKYYEDACALRLSSAPKYFEVVSRNIKIFHDRGVEAIVRHLVLPNHLECCSKPVLKWLAENTPRYLVNVMEQYYPTYLVLRSPEKYKEVARRPRTEEMREVYSYADELGLVWRPVS